MGTLQTRTLRILSGVEAEGDPPPDSDIGRIVRTYHAWRGEEGAGRYADEAGFCKAATIEDIERHGHVLTPGRYVDAAAVEDDGEPFEEKDAAAHGRFAGAVRGIGSVEGSDHGESGGVGLWLIAKHYIPVPSPHARKTGM